MTAFGCSNGENEADVNEQLGRRGREEDTVGGSEGAFGMWATTQCTEGRWGGIVVVFVQ